MKTNPDVILQRAKINRNHRQMQNGHRSLVIWFTGLSGAGKSTLARAIEEKLHHIGVRTYVLDGDNVRYGLSSDLGFSAADRFENIRRAGEVCKLLIDAGLIVLAAFISPFGKDRNYVRGMIEPGDFIEVYCNTPIEICELRDVKGIYKKARLGEILNFTGISSPYEAPENPELTVNTGTDELNICAQQVIDELHSRGVFR